MTVKELPNSQLIRTFNAWKLKPYEKAALLGRKSPPRLETQRLKRSEDLDERIKLVLEIEQLLESCDCADQASWIRSPEKSLSWMSPLHHMITLKISGLITVRHKLFVKHQQFLQS